MEHCSISEQGIVALASKLPNMLHLKTLNIRHNDCGQIGAEALRDALRVGTSGLVVLDYEKRAPNFGACCSPPNYYYDCTYDCRVAIDQELELNRRGRPLIRAASTTLQCAALWPRIFATIQISDDVGGRYSAQETILNCLREQVITYTR